MRNMARTAVTVFRAQCSGSCFRLPELRRSTSQATTLPRAVVRAIVEKTGELGIAILNAGAAVPGLARSTALT